MNKTLNFLGQTWQAGSGYPDEWSAQVDGRFFVNTWKFGSIHQSTVSVDYHHRVNGSMLERFRNGVYMGLRPGQTMQEAMQRGLDWVADYQKHGAPTSEEVFQNCWKYFPTLFPQDNRPSVINQLFFVVGSGYDWLDGCLINTYPDDYLESRSPRDLAFEKLAEEVPEIKAEMAKMDEEHQAYWQQEVYQFYPVSTNYSNICFVPDDVRPEWLKVTYEAALLLRDKSGVIPKKFSKAEEFTQKNNREVGTKVVEELEKRFPIVLE